MPKRKNNVDGKCGDAKKFKQATLCSKSAISDNWLQRDSLLIYKNPEVKASSKVLALDLDNTIITPASGRVFAKDANDWKNRFLSHRVPEVLKHYADEGYMIVIMSNQGGLDKMPEKRIPEFKTKLEAVFTKISVPVKCYFAILTDIYRKPRTGMWQVLEAENDGVEIDRKTSLYCGDAAGRVNVGSNKRDHSHCDRLFAENLGVPFKTPEELWEGGKGVGSTYPLLFDSKQLQGSSLPTASPLPLSLKDLSKKGVNLLLMVGYPASGKSTFCNDHLSQLGYRVVSRDAIKDMKKCAAQCEQLLKAGTSVCVDNTNVDVASRELFLKIAKSVGVPAYACVMQTTLDHSRHNEIFRQLSRSHHNKVSSIVFHQMKAKYQTPTKAEGFEDIFEIAFIPGFASDAERNLYFQHLLEK